MVIIADKKKWIRGFVLGITIPLGTIVSNLFRDNPMLMAFSFVIITTIPMFLILALTKNLGFEFPDLEELDAMDTATQLEVLENGIKSGAKALGLDMDFTAYTDGETVPPLKCGCDANCSCEIENESDYISDDGGYWHRTIYPATYNFKDIEDKDKDKEIKRSDVIELE